MVVSLCLFILCTFSLANAQILPIPWLYTNYTGSVKISNVGTFDLSGWIATNFDKDNELARVHTSATVVVFGQQTTTETLTFSRNGVVESYIIQRGSCQHTRQTFNADAYKQCMKFTWKDSTYRGKACYEGNAECEVIDNTTHTSVHLHNQAFVTPTEKTPLGAISEVKTEQTTTQSELVFTNTITTPLPETYFTIPRVCNNVKRFDDPSGCPELCKLWPKGCDANCEPRL